MRALVRWSLSSFMITTPRPWRAEPSRRMSASRWLDAGLEIPGVDRLEARLIDREPEQPAAGHHHRGRRVRPHVAVGHQPQAVGGDHLDGTDARAGPGPPGGPLPDRFHLDVEAA